MISPDARNYDRRLVHPPFTLEISADEINTVVAFLYGFAQGAVRTLRRLPIEEFVKKVDSDMILFGFHQGAFFEEQYEDRAEFITAWKEAKAAIEPSVALSDAIAGLRQRLQERFGSIPDWVEVWIANATLSQMGAWIKRIPDAPDLASVFVANDP